MDINLKTIIVTQHDDWVTQNSQSFALSNGWNHEKELNNYVARSY